MKPMLAPIEASKESKVRAFFDVFSGLETETARIVRTVFLLAFLTNFLFFSHEPILLLYLIYVKFVDDVDIRFFVWMEVVQRVIPFFGNIAMGALTSRIGARRALCILSLCCSFGLIFLVQTSAWRSGLIYVLGTVFLTFGHSIRIVRIIFLTERVPPSHRTTVIAVHDIWGSLGCSLGPIAWMVYEKFPFDISILNLFQFNKFTIDYLIGAGVGISMCLIAWLGLRDSSSQSIYVDEENGEKQEEQKVNKDGPKYVSIQLENSTIQNLDVVLYSRNTILFFITIMFLVKSSMGFLFVAFQPILVNKYQTDGKTMGIIFEAVFLVSLIVSFILAYLTRILEDRHVLLLGMLFKLVGVVMFLPVFGTIVHRWQVVAGFMLLVKASRFFSAGSISLCSKLLGPMSNGTFLGILSSVGQLGPAISQIFFTQLSLDLFGSFYYAFIGFPVLVAILLIIWPSTWIKLDSEREFLKVLFREYESTCTKTRRID